MIAGDEFKLIKTHGTNLSGRNTGAAKITHNEKFREVKLMTGQISTQRILSAAKFFCTSFRAAKFRGTTSCVEIIDGEAIYYKYN